MFDPWIACDKYLFPSTLGRVPSRWDRFAWTFGPVPFCMTCIRRNRWCHNGTWFARCPNRTLTSRRTGAQRLGSQGGCTRWGWVSGIIWPDDCDCQTQERLTIHCTIMGRGRCNLDQSTWLPSRLSISFKFDELWAMPGVLTLCPERCLPPHVSKYVQTLAIHGAQVFTKNTLRTALFTLHTGHSALLVSTTSTI